MSLERSAYVRGGGICIRSIHVAAVLRVEESGLGDRQRVRVGERIPRDERMKQQQQHGFGEECVVETKRECIV